MNTNPGRYAAALGAAMIALSLSLYVNPDGWRDAVLLPMAVFGAVLAVAAIAGALPELIRDYAHARLMWARNRHEAANLGRQMAGEAVPVVTVDNADPRLEMWREYWIAAIKYSEEAGALSYRKMAPFFGTDEVWRDCFVRPFQRQGYIPATIGREGTIWDEGWTAEKVRWRLEAGVGLPVPPPSPSLPPDKFPSQDTADTRENTVNYGETRTTQYAKDAPR